MEKERTINTQIRIPPDLYGYVQSNSERLCVSQNAFMMILMDLGRKAYENRTDSGTFTNT
jgi:hypothetical protein